MPILTDINPNEMTNPSRSPLETLLFLYKQEKADKVNTSFVSSNKYVDLMMHHEEVFEALLKDLVLDGKTLKKLGESLIKDSNITIKDNNITLDQFKQELRELRKKGINEKEEEGTTEKAMDCLKTVLVGVAYSLLLAKETQERTSVKLTDPLLKRTSFPPHEPPQDPSSWPCL